MDAQNTKKLKFVLDAVPAGYLVDARWLVAQGIAYESFRDYVRRGWLARISRGVFRRPVLGEVEPERVDWKVCLLSMQHIMGHDLHVGGATALAQYGHAHYLYLGSSAPVWVYGDAIPGWLGKLSLSAPVKCRRRSLFKTSSLGVVKGASGVGALPWDWELGTSVPERAILETLDELPDQESFHNTDMMFESLVTLRPKVLSALLQDCRKIKVRRLFFVFADRHDHPWRKRLDPAGFDLGSGDRALVKGGRMHPRYRIMVPEEFVETEGRNDAEGGL